MKNVLENLLDRLQFGEVQTYQNLSVLPLLDGPDGEPAYLSMKEGLDRQLVEISEVSEGGSAPNLKVINKAEWPIILVDGEELIVFLNGQVLGSDYISRNSAYRNLHEKLIRSHAIEALSEPTEQPSEADLKIDGRLFLKALTEAPEVTQHDAVGLGEDYRYDGENVSGAILFYEDTAVHLTAFHPDSIDRLEQRPEQGSQPWSLSNRIRRKFRS